jgi:hypothetical protein
MTDRRGRQARNGASCGSLATLLFVLLASCETATGPSATHILSSRLSAPSPLARSLQLMLAEPAPMEVDYWAPGAPRLRVRSPSASLHSLSLTRLRPGRDYQYEVEGTTVAGTFTTDPLPADLARVVVSASGTRTVPLVLVHLYEPGGFMGYAILDDANEVVWYFRTEDFPFGVTRRANGDFVVMDKARGLVELSPAGEAVHELAQDVVRREMHHDVVASPDNTLLFIAFDDRKVDGATVRGDAIWEWNPETGAESQRWTGWDHFTVANAPAPPVAGEWMHANSLAIGPRKNVVLSVHHWNQVISIAAGWTTIEWRLGGVGATAAVAPADAFSGQHTARELSANHVVVFDNGIDRGGYSRAVEFAMNGSAASVNWEFRPSPVNFAAAIGSARRLANGHTLVAFGMSAGLLGSTGPTEVYEVDEAGSPVWHLLLSTQSMFRAEPLDAVGTEEVVSSPLADGAP